MAPSLKKYIWALIIVAILGFLDASYLTVAHYLKAPIPCGLVQGCDVVTTSAYSEIAGVPVALLGALYYLTILILSIISLEKADRRLLRYTSHLTWSGLIASLYFVAIQLFVLKAICLWCMGSAITSTALFVLGLFVIKLLNADRNQSVANPPLASL
ncbi:MAG: vitamin K epoxide reductase family protein [bacterium]